jgi:hypothetical protein
LEAEAESVCLNPMKIGEKLFQIGHMIVSFVPPHFWAQVVSTVIYLINIQPSSVLQGGILFEHLCDMTSDYFSLHLFSCVCYVPLAPRVRTKALFVCTFDFKLFEKLADGWLFDFRCWLL